MRYIFISLVSFITFFLSSANAYEGKWDKHNELDFRIIIGSINSAIGYGAFELNLKENWKTYWRTPGDAGLPIEANIIGAKNIDILWPIATRFIDKNQILIYGYKNKILIPFKFIPVVTNGSVNFNITGEYGVCKTLCVAHDFAEKIVLPNNYKDTSVREKINLSLTNLPVLLTSASVINAKIIANKKFVTINLPPSTHLGKIEDVLIEAGENFRFFQPKIVLSQGVYKITTPFEALNDDQLTGKTLSLTIVGTDKAVTFKHKITSKINSIAQDDGNILLWLSIIFSAFLGGLILNIMPCVFPVIALKLNHITSAKHKLSGKVQLSLTVLGILLSFSAFAVIVGFMQQAGQIVGWGFHFQQPVFVIAMSAILILFAASQLGLFILRLPGESSGKLDSILNKLSPDKAYFHLFYGVIVTLLATPCTAPFLGSAVAFALTQSFWVIWLIFLSVAVGLSAPYITFLILPLPPSKLLPKPGQWMNYVKYGAGILLYVSSLWLLWVLSQQIGVLLALILFALIHLSVFCLAKKRLILIGILLLVAVIITPLFVNNLSESVNAATETDKLSLNWHTFDQSKIKGLISANKTIFIDITASWCLSCKYNKWHVLSDEEVKRSLAQENIYLMRGDLTKVNKKIMSFIKQHNRAGVPFNAVISKNSTQLLSEILDKKTLIRLLNKS